MGYLKGEGEEKEKIGEKAFVGMYVDFRRGVSLRIPSLHPFPTLSCTQYLLNESSPSS